MNLALCCISNELADRGIKFQTMTYSRFSSLPRIQALTTLSERILNNFQVTHRTIKHCIATGIKGYRLSSSITPLLNHPDMQMTLDQLPNFDVIADEIDATAKTIANNDIRISAHPSEYISLTSKEDRVINNSILDLEMHAMIFDLLQLPCDYRSPLNIHCRQDGDPEDISSRFMHNFNKLSSSVRNRLVLENNDNAKGVWSIKNLYNIFHLRHGIPITFDNLHHKMLSGDLSEQEAFELAYSTWPTTPLFHYSEGIGNTRNHADYAVDIPQSYDKMVYWDCELKMKDWAIYEILKNVKQRSTLQV
jgi:UV DNA damage endonuclease